MMRRSCACAKTATTQLVSADCHELTAKRTELQAAKSESNKTLHVARSDKELGNQKIALLSLQQETSKPSFNWTRLRANLQRSKLAAILPAAATKAIQHRTNITRAGKSKAALLSFKQEQATSKLDLEKRMRDFEPEVGHARIPGAA